MPFSVPPRATSSSGSERPFTESASAPPPNSHQPTALPSIWSLRTKFQAFTAGGAKKRASNGPKIIKGDTELVPGLAGPPRARVAGGLTRFGSVGGVSSGNSGAGIAAKRRASDLDLKGRSFGMEAAAARPSLDGFPASLASEDSDVLDISVRTAESSSLSSSSVLPSPILDNSSASITLPPSPLTAAGPPAPGRPLLSSLRPPKRTGSLLRRSPPASRLTSSSISSPLASPAETPAEEDAVLEIRTPPKPLWPSIHERQQGLEEDAAPTFENKEKQKTEYQKLSSTGQAKLLVEVHEKKISDNNPPEPLSPTGSSIPTLLELPKDSVASPHRVTKKSSTGILDFYTTPSTPTSSTPRSPPSVPDLPNSPLLQQYAKASPALSETTIKNTLTGSPSFPRVKPPPLNLSPDEDAKAGELSSSGPELTTSETHSRDNSTSSSVSFNSPNVKVNHASIESTTSGTNSKGRPSSTNTFGDPLEEREIELTPVTMSPLSPASRSDVPPTPLSIAPTSPRSTHDFIPPRLNELRRAKSSIDKPRSLFKESLPARTVIEPSTPENPYNGALYRSASARPATRTVITSPSRTSLQVRRVRSATWEPPVLRGEFGRSRAGTTPPDNEVHLDSPLDRLISGLGGKIQPAGSSSAVDRRDSFEVGPSPVVEINSTWHEKDENEHEFTARMNRTDTSAGSGLSVEEMEREIARMEAELALVGHPSAPFSSEPPSPDDSSPGNRLVDLWTSPRRDSSATTGHDSFTSYAPTDAEITPRTAKRWSIVDVEQAYKRMKDMLGSTRSLAGMSDAGTLAEDREADGSDVEGAFERVIKNSILIQSNGMQGGEDKGAAGSRYVDLWPFQASMVHELTFAFLTSRPASQVDTARPDEFETSPSGKSIIGGQPMEIATSSSSSVATSSYRRRTHSSPDTLALPEYESSISKARSSGSLIASPPISPRAPRLATSDRADPTHRESSSPAGERSRIRLAGLRPLSRMSERASTAMSGMTEESREGWATPLTSPSSRAGVSRSSSRLSITPNGMIPRESAGRAPDSDSPRKAGLVGISRGGGSTYDEYADSIRQRYQQRRSSLDVRSRTSLDFRTKDESLRLPRSSSRLSQSYITDEAPELSRSSDFAPRRTSRSANHLAASSETWFPSTPDRSAHRVKAAAPRFSLRESDIEGRRPLSSSVDMAAIRGMDKLEIFFKYAAMKADLEKAEMERDALMDALQETRAILSDVRAQRDMLERQVQGGRSSSRQIEKILGSDSETQGERLQDLVRSRQVWETRANDARDELDHVRDETESLRFLVLEGRAREEKLERELLSQSSGYTTGGKSERGHQTSDSVGFSSNPDDDDASVQDVIIASASTFTLRGKSTSPLMPSPQVSPLKSSPVRSTLPRSPSRSPRHRLPFPTSSVTPATPSSQLISGGHRTRNSALFSPEAAGPLLTDVEGTPLMEQNAPFGAKSSFGSIDSPLKPRAGTYTNRGSLGRGSIPRPSRLSSHPPYLPLPGVVVGSHVKMSSISSTSSDDHGDHLPLPKDRDWNALVEGTDMPELEERDEQFLSDLSGTIG